MGRSLRALLAWAGFLAALCGLAVVLAPPLHNGLVDAGIGRADRFDRTVRYIVFVPLVLVFLAVFRPWRDGMPRSYGPPRARAFFGGWLAAFLLLVAVLALQLAWGWLAWEDPLSLSDAGRRVVKFGLSGLLVAAIEEWFFRGWMDRRLRRALSPVAAALVVAGIYAVLHVFTARDGADAAPATTAGVFEVFGLWMGRLLDPATALPKLLGLALFSLVLTAAYRRTRTLVTAIGVHAAAICVLYSYGALTDRVAEPTLLTGGKNVYDGLLGWVVLGLVLALLARRGSSDAGSTSRV